MARVLYIDCFSGVAGDMLLAAFIDAGLPVEALTSALGSLRVDHELVVSRVIRAGVSATRVEVVDREHAHTHEHSHPHSHAHHHHEGHTHAHHEHRTLKEIAGQIDRSNLSPAAKSRAVHLFNRIGEAEAAIHGVSIDQIHLHEVGALDSIIDIVGNVFAFEWFAIDDVVVSPLNVGSGTVEIAHGRFPVPAPATLKLLQGVPVYSGEPAVELVTPTGALLVSDYARSYGQMPPMTIEKVGYGAGTRDFDRMPNVVRLAIGERTTTSTIAGVAGGDEDVVKIECEIDDMNPQLFEPASELLFKSGALDVFFAPVQMKKGRPGTLVTVLAPEGARESLVDILFRETTTIGVRFERMRREVLKRRIVEVPTSGGTVRIKVAERAGQVLNAVPEFEDCLRIARASGRPVKAVQDEATSAWLASERH